MTGLAPLLLGCPKYLISIRSEKENKRSHFLIIHGKNMFFMNSTSNSNRSPVNNLSHSDWPVIYNDLNQRDEDDTTLFVYSSFNNNSRHYHISLYTCIQMLLTFK